MHITLKQTWDGQPSLPEEEIELHFHKTPSGLLWSFEAPFWNDPAPKAPPGSHWGLWEYEAVELFLLGHNDAYLEVEVGPHGHHLVLALKGVRNHTKTTLSLNLHTSIEGQKWSARALIPWHLLPPGLCKFNAYALHGRGSQRRFLALHPVPGKTPDFHRLHCFAPFSIQDLPKHPTENLSPGAVSDPHPQRR